MKPPRPSLENESALLGLLDDTQPEIRRALLVHFQQNAAPAALFLEDIAKGRNRILAWHARWFLEELHFADPLSEFKGFIRSLSHDLETGALLLCRVRSPQVDIEAITTELDAMAQRCRELTSEPMSLREKCRLINRVIFHEYGLHGNHEHFSDPLNSFVDQVILRRKGIPISLCLIYWMVARRIGVPLEPVGLPGHFILGCYSDETAFFIDTFENGTFYSGHALPSVLQSPPSSPKSVDLAPTAAREVLCRCCRNLVLHYAAAGDSEASRVYAELVEEFETSF